ncbi:Uncharacterized protein QTN25_008965 [Entamoeba marina]
MEDFPIAQPIPQQHFRIENLNTTSSSSITPSSFSFKIDQFIPNNIDRYHHNLPPPDENPIPFDSVNFSQFHANFDSPTTMDYDTPNDASLYQSEETFSYQL